LLLVPRSRIADILSASVRGPLSLTQQDSEIFSRCALRRTGCRRSVRFRYRPHPLGCGEPIGVL